MAPIRFCSVLLAVSILSSSQASAQTPADSFAGLTAALKTGQQVVVTLHDVTDARGRAVEVVPVTGRVVSVIDKELVIRTGRGSGAREVRLAENEVRRIHKPDSPWPSALIGGGIGVLLAVPYVNRPRPDLGDEAAGAEVAFPVLGFIIGWVIDASVERTLYRSPRQTTMFFTPTLGPGRVGIVVAMRFQ